MAINPPSRPQVVVPPPPPPREPWTRFALCAAGLVIAAMAALFVFNTHLTTKVNEVTASGTTANNITNRNTSTNSNKTTTTTSAASDTVVITFFAVAAALILAGAFFDRLRTLKVTVAGATAEVGLGAPVVTSDAGDQLVGATGVLITNEGQTQKLELDPELLFEAGLARDRVHETRRLTYDLDNDKTEIIVESTPLPGKSLRFRSLSFHVAPTIIPDDANLTLKAIGMSARVDSGAERLVVIPVAEHQRLLRAVIFFVPPSERVVTWSYRYRPPGLWKPLRDTGSDEGSVRLQEGIDRFTLRFIFPRGFNNVGLDVLDPQTVRPESVQRSTQRGRQVIALTLVSELDGLGTYKYRITGSRQPPAPAQTTDP
jgi:hypothetical protein